ncbi:ABC transporter permease [Blastococcus haudaquaticus]|uniref:Monosaccharide ABC transporter membrane protein, CUT2 family n=1 Tax=Blastococcus haudaquaticus TaxID=1938745 RepID=A0A286GXA6_9ACTN|nr:ABC transporter permease [Blastococcus haudaquaticus]SOE00122.1 monosaccharide ABC transporter membrane protein, CUT2 family [Blastococcus haudaquaticus]
MTLPVRISRSPLLWPLAALLALLLFNLVVNPGFFTVRIQDGHLFGSLVDVLKNGSPTLLIALGMTLVIASRGVDLSVGAVVAISAAIACTSIASADDPSSPGAAIVAMTSAIGVGLLLGAWNGLLVSVFGIQPIIATLVLMTAGRGIAMLITDGQIITVNNETYSWLGGGHVLGLPAQVVVTGLILLLVAVLTRRTALGMLVEAVGINPAAARLAGVRSRSITWTVYVFAAFAASVAGLMISAQVNAADANRAGLFIELDAILAVVIGGTSLAGGRYSLTGTVIGALVLQTLTTTVYSVGIPSQYSTLFKAVVIIVVFLLQAPRLRAALRRRRRPAPPPPASGGLPSGPVPVGTDLGPTPTAVGAPAVPTGREPSGSTVVGAGNDPAEGALR